MRRKIDIYSLLYRLLVLIGVITTILFIYFIQFNDINNLFLLPLSYTLSMIMVKKYYSGNGIGVAVGIIEITKFVRYIILPLAFALSGTFVRNDLRPSYHSMAVNLMCYELLAVSLVMLLFIILHPAVRCNVKVTTKQSVIVYAVAFAWILLVIFVGSYRRNLLNFSVNEDSNLSGGQTAGGGLILSCLFTIGIIYIYSVLINLSKYAKTNRNKLLVILIASLFFISSYWNDGGESISRWGLVLGFILSLYALFIFFPEKKKTVLLGGFTTIFVVLGGATILKIMTWGVDVDTLSTISEMSNSTGFLSISDQLDSYFQGVYSVSNGIATADIYSGRIGFMNFVNEFLNHFPGAFQLLDLKNYTIAEVFFKNGLHDDALICPSLIQSYYYFGEIGSPFFSCLAVITALLFTEQMQKECNLTIKLFYLASIFWLSLYNCINFAIVEAHIWFYMFGILICKVGDWGRTRNALPQRNN